jgi:hypothetical protein
LLLLATGLAPCLKANRQASLRSDLVLPQALLAPAEASGTHAARCSDVPRLSCTAAVVAQSNIASTSNGGPFFEIISITPISGFRSNAGKKRDLRDSSCSQKAE